MVSVFGPSPKSRFGPSISRFSRILVNLMSIVVHCQYCSRKLKAPENARGKQVRCPYCSKSLLIPDKDESEILLPAPEGPKVVFACKTCGHSLEVPTSVLGQDIACPFCDDVQQVPLNATLVFSSTQEPAQSPPTRSSRSRVPILDDDLFAPVSPSPATAPPAPVKNVPKPDRRPAPLPSSPPRPENSFPKPSPAPPPQPPTAAPLSVPAVAPPFDPAAYDPLDALADLPELPNADPFAGFYGPQPTAPLSQDPFSQQPPSFSTRPIYQSPRRTYDGTAPIGEVFQRFYRTSSQNFGALFLLGIKFAFLAFLTWIAVSLLMGLTFIVLAVALASQGQAPLSVVIGFMGTFFCLSFLFFYPLLSIGMYSVSYRIASGKPAGDFFSFAAGDFWKFLLLNGLLGFAAFLLSIPVYGIVIGTSLDVGQGRTDQAQPIYLAMRNAETWWDTAPSSGAKTPPQEDITPPREDKTPPPEDKPPSQEEKKSPARNEYLPPAPKETPLPPADQAPHLAPGTGTTEAESSGQPTIKRRRPRSQDASPSRLLPPAPDSGDRFKQELPKTPADENGEVVPGEKDAKKVAWFFSFNMYGFLILSILTFWSCFYIIDCNAGPLQALIYSVGFFFRNFPTTLSGTLLFCGIPWLMTYGLSSGLFAVLEPQIASNPMPAALIILFVLFLWYCFCVTVIWPLRFAFAAVAYRVAYRG